MTDVTLELDADHANLISRAVVIAARDNPDLWTHEQTEVLRGVLDVIDRQLAPEAME